MVPENARALIEILAVVAVVLAFVDARRQPASPAGKARRERLGWVAGAAVVVLLSLVLNFPY